VDGGRAGGQGPAGLTRSARWPSASTGCIHEKTQHHGRHQRMNLPLIGGRGRVSPEHAESRNPATARTKQSDRRCPRHSYFLSVGRSGQMRSASLSWRRKGSRRVHPTVDDGATFPHRQICTSATRHERSTDSIQKASLLNARRRDRTRPASDLPARGCRQLGRVL
jgi:hypothetical protein